MLEILVELAASTLRLATPLILAGLAGVMIERSGVTDIALEAKLLLGAFFAALTTHFLGSSWLGLVAACASGILVTLMLALAALIFKADQIVTGIALNLFAFGIPPLFGKVLFDMTAATPALQQEQLFVWAPSLLGIAAAFVMHIWFQHFRGGLEVRIAGEMPETLTAAGRNPLLVRLKALVIGGALAGVAGASLSLMLASGFSRNMSAGRGFIALAAMILGNWKPLPTLFACLSLGFFDAIQLRLQDQTIAGLKVDPTLIQLLPYAITLVVVAGFVGKSQAPKALGKPS